jgi:hypothetical protein
VPLRGTRGWAFGHLTSFGSTPAGSTSWAPDQFDRAHLFFCAVIGRSRVRCRDVAHASKPGASRGQLLRPQCLGRVDACSAPGGYESGQARGGHEQQPNGQHDAGIAR